jgi:two-component system, NarL family, nitrate/nitrite response regulator NarL
MATEHINIIIVDDHPIVLEGMENILKNMIGIDLIGKATNAMEAISLLRNHQIDLVITDINLPEISGIELCKKITTEFPKIKVIGMSTFQDKAYISEMIQNGALGYLTKSASPEEIENAIRATMNNQMTIQVNNYSGVLKQTEKVGPILTRREKEVLELVSQGLTNKEIADKLFVSQSTIDSHRKNLLSKFEVLNTASLIANAAKAGLLGQ